MTREYLKAPEALQLNASAGLATGHPHPLEHDMSNELAERLEAAAERLDGDGDEWGAVSVMREAARAIREAGWQPIETAPKHEVLLFWPASKPARGRNGNTLTAMLRVGTAGGTPFREPTHWMPLPAAPTPDQERTP